MGDFTKDTGFWKILEIAVLNHPILFSFAFFWVSLIFLAWKEKKSVKEVIFGKKFPTWKTKKKKKKKREK